jgi:hypothetical protein
VQVSIRRRYPYYIPEEEIGIQKKKREQTTMVMTIACSMSVKTLIKYRQGKRRLTTGIRHVLGIAFVFLLVKKK